MPASLPVELNADRIHEIRVIDEFETDGPFVVDLVNEGQPVHVHVSLDEDLGRVASLDGGNHYVEEGTTVAVPISVDPVDEPTVGRLTVATGYGAETSEVLVTVRPWEGQNSGVEVDEDLSTPGEPTAASAATAESPGPSLPLLALVGTVLAVAVGVGIAFPSTPVLVGVGVVVGAALATLALSFR